MIHRVECRVSTHFPTELRYSFPIPVSEIPIDVLRPIFDKMFKWTPSTNFGTETKCLNELRQSSIQSTVLCRRRNLHFRFEYLTAPHVLQSDDTYAVISLENLLGSSTLYRSTHPSQLVHPLIAPSSVISNKGCSNKHHHDVSHPCPIPCFPCASNRGR